MLKALKSRLQDESEPAEIVEAAPEVTSVRDENYRNNTFNQLFEMPHQKGWLYSLNVHSEVETNVTFDPYYAQLTLQKMPLFESTIEEPRVFENCI